MKILVISLLRIGDAVMHSVVISGLKQQHPNAKINILVNEISEKVVRMNPLIDQVITFPRNIIQSHLVEENRPILRAMNHLKELASILNRDQYDLVVNLTHNQLSARLMDLISSKAKSGIHYENGSLSRINNNWLSYLNEYYKDIKKAQFHYIDITAESVKVGVIQVPVAKESSGKRIGIQVLTSDIKKNWPMKNFLELVTLLIKQYPQNKVTILGAPDEEDLLREKFGMTPGLDFKFDRWNELNQTLDECALFITGDTSVQHFAALRMIPMLGLFMGSANPTKTAPYLAGAVVIQSKINCTPCEHSQKCWKSTIECAEEISVEDVFRVTQSMLDKRELPTIQSRLFQVQKRMTGRFYLAKVGGDAKILNFRSALEQTVWEMYLSESYKEGVATFGSSAHQILEEHIRPFATAFAKIYLIERLQKCEMDQICAEQLHQLIIESARLGFCYDQVQDSLTSYLMEHTDTADYFFLTQEILRSEDSGFQKTKRLSLSNRETSTLLKIENKLIRTLLNEINEINEREIRYGKGFRTTSDFSSSTP